MTPHTRRLSELHDIFLYVAILLGFIALITAAATPWWAIIGFPLAMIGAHYFYRAGIARDAHNHWWNSLVVVAALASIAQHLLNPALDVMVIGVRFVLILTLIKLFSRQGPRDELQIYALSFLAMAAASEVNQQFYYGLIFGLYVLVGTFGLALFHLKTEADNDRGWDPSRTSPFDSTYVSVLATISVLIFVSSLVIFFAFPRIGLGLFSDPSRNSIPIAGFDDEVQVGDHGSVRDNPEIVMRVDFEDERPTNYTTLRWRTRTFDHYDGWSWSQSISDDVESAPYSTQRNYDLDFLYSPALQQTFSRRSRATVKVQLEPLGTDVIPTLWPTERIQLGEADATRIGRATDPTLDYDDYGDLYHGLPDDVGLNYELTVQPPPDDELLRRSTGRTLNAADAERYLQTPDSSDRVAELADELTVQAESNYEKAEAVVEHMHREFAYTLDLPEIDGDDPVDEFLFDHRAGHCEYFATSGAMLLREAGVPTRLVNGFLGGTWNDVGDYLTVRHGDAHAWLEVFVPEYGWVPVDPTPPIESTFLERTGITRALEDAIDSMRRGWTIWFIEYDFDAQLSLFEDIGRTLAPDAPDTEPTTDDDEDDEAPLPIRHVVFWTGWLALVATAYWRSHTSPSLRSRRWAAGLLVAVCCGAIWTGWFRGWAFGWSAAGAVTVFAAGIIPAVKRLGDTPEQLRVATRLFETIERRARRADLARRPDEGPGEFLNRIGDQTPVPEAAITAFRRLYLGIRFGDRRLDDDGRRRLENAADQILSALSKM